MTSMTGMLGLCLLLTLPFTVFTCSCIPDRPSVMDYICGSHFAIKAEVTGIRDYVYGKYNYTGTLISVNILQTYKASDEYQQISQRVKNEIHTESDGASCGWSPSNGIYIIVGYINEEDRPSIGLCDYNRSWNQASYEDKDVLQAYTDDGKRCKYNAGSPTRSLLAICVCTLLTMGTLLQRYI